ncbi:uncharacterized protein LOC110458370 [Mizuhopecten yessoensis]|uniref:uncharacterized protein LOC110458370 n=1 Tax=Mizuhopecten yessoensis TaxID=6573 RepID=UPI000B458366|nr:uncharacterized protein LOC110458370 [Mizuhopecten yessoensis]
MKNKEDIWMDSMFGNTIKSRMSTSHPDFGNFPTGYYSTHPGAVIYGARSLKFLHYKDVRRDRRRAVTFILLLAAFFISFCVAIIVFFVVMNGNKKATYDYHVANVSMPLWNTTWDDDMEIVTSDRFIDIALPFCDEIDGYFEEGPYSSQYKGCTVKNLTQYNTADCQCSGILGDTLKPVVLLTFDLLFVNTLTEDEIMSSILDQTRAKYVHGYRLLFVGDFLIDITGYSVITPSPLEPGVVEGTYVHARYGLYSFNYTTDLQEVRSPRFEGLQMSFCENLKKFLEFSIISENHDECGILTFRQYPLEIDFYLTFALPRGSYITNNITWVLANIAPGTTVNGLDLAYVGDLTLILSPSVITLSKINFTVVTTTLSTVQSLSTTTTTTTTTTPAPPTPTPAPPTPTPTPPTTTQTPKPPTTTQTPKLPTTTQTPKPPTTPTTATTIPTTKPPPPTTTTTPLPPTTTTPPPTTTKKPTTITTATTQSQTSTPTTSKAPVTCNDQPCENSGFCRVLELGGFFCQCPGGYTGTRCETDVNECAMSPCKNGGSCKNNPGSYTCDCVGRWTGQNCADSLGECDSSPCRNNGTCVATPGGYFCVCPTGWTGTQCLDDIDECTGVSCTNGGSCVNTDGSFHCQCTSGWTGLLCSTRIDECTNSPCANGGMCFNGPNTYFCTCSAGWTGFNCDVDINECDVQIEPCYNGASCHNVDGSYTCECTVGWKGTYCEINVNECQTGVCDHAASCVDSAGSYTCICTSGWTGQNCSDDINECSLGMTMCLFGGTCVNQDGGYKCVCPPGRTGLVCSEDEDECALGIDNCMSGSTCINNKGSYTCRCPPGITGQFCTEDIDECLQFPCQNDGTCNDILGSYTCTCSAAWTGHDCDQVINECSSGPCKNGATCVTEPGTYRCVCETGWMGTNCDIDTNECSTSPCLNGGTCTNQDGSYDCTCLPQNSGRHCEETIYACISNPCANEATCLDASSGDFTCICNPGWSGATCNQNDDECLTSPCQNGADCMDTPGSFYCQCPTGFTGQFCGEDIKECAADPCFNGGVCVDTPGSFYCDCPPGWQGDLCSSDVNECNTLPCNNNGDCINVPGSYVCVCASGWTGQDCSTDINECDTQPCGPGSCQNIDGSFTCNCPVGRTGPTCDQVLRTTFVFYLSVLNRTFTTDLSNNSSQEFISLSTSFCNEVKTILESSQHQQQFAHFYGCNVANFRDNPFIMNVELTFNGNETISTLKAARVQLLNKKPALYSGRFGVTLGDVVVEVQNYNATRKTWNAHLVNLMFTPDLLNPASVSYRTVDNSLSSDVGYLMRSASPFEQNYVGCIVENIQNATSITNSSMATLAIYMDSAFNMANLQDGISDFLSNKRPLVRYGDYMGHNLGEYIVYFSDYTGYVDVPLTLEILDHMWLTDLADPQTQAYKQLATPLCKAVANLISANSTLSADFQKCMDVRFSEVPLVVNLTLRFDSANMTYDVKSLDFYTYIKDATPQQIYFNYYSHTLGPLLVFHPSWGMIAYDAVLFDTEFEFYDLKYIPDHSDPNSTVFKDFQLLFCKDIDAFISATVLKDRYYGCLVHPIGDTDPHNLTLRIVFNGTDDVTQQDIITAIANGAPTSTFSNRVIWEIGKELVYLADESMGQPINMSGYTTPAPLDIVFTEYVVTFQALNITYIPALADRTSIEFSSLAVPLRDELVALYRGKQEMEDYITSEVLSFRENPDEVDVTLIFDGRQISTLGTNIHDVLLEYARRASTSSGQPALMIGTLLFDQNEITIRRSITSSTNTTSPATTRPTTTAATTPTTTTPASTSPAAPCEGVLSFGEVSIPVPNHCRKYFVCFLDSAIDAECPVGEAFDPNVPGFCAADSSCVD